MNLHFSLGHKWKYCYVWVLAQAKNESVDQSEKKSFKIFKMIQSHGRFP